MRAGFERGCQEISHLVNTAVFCTISYLMGKKNIFSLAIQSNSFPANLPAPTLPLPPNFLCHFCVILAPEPAIPFGNMAEWLSGPIMPLCLEILFA